MSLFVIPWKVSFKTGKDLKVLLIGLGEGGGDEHFKEGLSGVLVDSLYGQKGWGKKFVYPK